MLLVLDLDLDLAFLGNLKATHMLDPKIFIYFQTSIMQNLIEP